MKLSPGHANPRFGGLDILRFSAALGVVFYHYVDYLASDRPEKSELMEFLRFGTQYGYLGVPLFFMISGFVIFASARNRKGMEFAAVRVARLYPVYWLAVILTAVVVTLVEGRHIPYSVFAANLTMLHGYFNVPNIDDVYWTLGKEIQFYLLIFVLIVTGQFRRDKIWISIWLACTASYLLIRQPFFMGKFITPEYSAFFIAGIVFYRIAELGITPFYAWCALLSLAMSCFSIYHIAPQFIAGATGIDSWISVAAVCAFFMLLFRISRGGLTIAPGSVWIGLGSLTYPLYLIHSANGRILLDAMVPGLGPSVALAVALLIMLGGSWIISQYYESSVATPFKSWLLRKIPVPKAENSHN